MYIALPPLLRLLLSKWKAGFFNRSPDRNGNKYICCAKPNSIWHAIYCVQSFTGNSEVIGGNGVYISHACVFPSHELPFTLIVILVVLSLHSPPTTHQRRVNNGDEPKESRLPNYLLTAWKGLAESNWSCWLTWRLGVTFWGPSP